MEDTKKKLFVERDGFWTESAMMLIALAMVFRLIGSIGRWDDLQYLTTQVALPILCGLLLILCLLLFGKRGFWTTVVPVVMGVVFFVFRAMNMENQWARGCWIIVYLVIMVLYAMVFSYPRLKWVLALVLLGVFAYHIGVMDLPKLMNLKNPVSFVDGMEEMSVLGIILAMLCLSLAMKAAPKPAKGKAETAPTPEAETAPEAETETTAAEPVPAQPAEKKLSRREQRKLEKQQRLEEKKREKEKTEGKAEENAEEPQQPKLPEETEAPAPAPWAPAEEPTAIQESSTPEQETEIVPETEPVPETAAPAEETPLAEQPEITVEEIEVEEPGFRAEPASAYPLDEDTMHAQEEPAPEGGSQNL